MPRLPRAAGGTRGRCGADCRRRPLARPGLDSRGEGGKSGICRLKWVILESGDDAVVQIIYAGNANYDPTLEGAADGQRDGIVVEKYDLTFDRDADIAFGHFSMTRIESPIATRRTGSWSGRAVPAMSCRRLLREEAAASRTSHHAFHGDPIMLRSTTMTTIGVFLLLCGYRCSRLSPGERWPPRLRRGSRRLQRERFDRVALGKFANWYVADGAITGENSPQRPCTKCNYLFWRGGKPADFELRCLYRVSSQGNSGVQFRSRELPDFDVAGYQADILRATRKIRARFTTATACERSRGAARRS